MIFNDNDYDNDFEDYDTHDEIIEDYDDEAQANLILKNAEVMYMQEVVANILNYKYGSDMIGYCFSQGYGDEELFKDELVLIKKYKMQEELRRVADERLWYKSLKCNIINEMKYHPVFINTMIEDNGMEGAFELLGY